MFIQNPQHQRVFRQHAIPAGDALEASIPRWESHGPWIDGLIPNQLMAQP